METAIVNAIRKIGYTLLFYRRSRELSQIDLAEKVGISIRCYQRLEGGETIPQLDTLVRISKALNIEFQTLLHCFDEETLGIREVSTKAEMELFQALKALTPLREIEKVIQKMNQLEVSCLKQDRFYPFHFNGNIAEFDDGLQKHLQVPQQSVNLDDYVIGSKSVDFWEYVSRKRLKSVKRVSPIRVASDLRFIESFHQIISSSAENPKSIGYIRDCTSQQELKNWFLNSKTGPARYQ